jgi:hypothetical protein
MMGINIANNQQTIIVSSKIKDDAEYTSALNEKKDFIIKFGYLYKRSKFLKLWRR